MNKLNRLKFDNYRETDYLKNQDKGESHFKVVKNFPKALGFDHRTGGFIVIHKQHSPSGLINEIPACLILKKMGYGIELVKELPTEKSLDVLIDDIAFEMKCFTEGKDLQNGIQRHFKRTYQKSKNLLLHVEKKVEVSNLRRAIKNASERYRKIETVLLIHGYKTVLLDREKMKNMQYDL